MIGWTAIFALTLSTAAQAAGPSEVTTAAQAIAQAQALFSARQYFKAARYAFQAGELEPARRPEALAWVSNSLVKAGLPHAASYFFIETLRTGDRAAIRRIASESEPLLARVGVDLLRKYLTQFARPDDFDSRTRGVYLYALGKQDLLAGHYPQAVSSLSGVPASSPLWPYALELRGTAYAIRGEIELSLRDYAECVRRAGVYADYDPGLEDLTLAQFNRLQRAREAQDLLNRCRAGRARVLYQAGKFEAADLAYDEVEKGSLVWPDILFEQAWTAFALEQYNKTLGKLVSYKSPALQFVFNSEVEVLRAQTYLMLCLYTDASEVINEFTRRYSGLGIEIKGLLERDPNNLLAYFQKGKEALAAPVGSATLLHRLMNRFVRGPYFQNLVYAERSIGNERAAIGRFAAAPGASATGGFPAFLSQVLDFRLKTVRSLGGAFIRNSLLDHYSILLGDFEKIAFIRLEILSRAKERLLTHGPALGERVRGDAEPSRRDHQYKWGFNGEFWNDELGDYIFGLKSECASAKGAS